MDQIAVDRAVLRALQERAEQLTRGERDLPGIPLTGEPLIDDLRRALDVLGAHTTQGLQHQHAYIAALSTAQEAERARIARELHDDVVQQLIALGHSVDWIQRTLDRGDAPRATERLGRMREQITTMVGELRTVIGDLRPPALEELGLRAAVEVLLARGSSATLTPTLTVTGTPRRLAPQSELAVFRILQEAWSNSQHHAAATQVVVAFVYGATGLDVTIRDNGSGFVQPTLHEAPDGHWGLRGMRERAELTGGTLTVMSQPSAGTQIELHIPYPGVNDRDPVCGMRVGPESLGTTHAGEQYRFCSPACRDLFLARPHHYTTPTTTE